jgi:acetyl-CoA C-acetyltransferase
MKATMLAHDIIKAGSAEIVLSGGMESMSNAPYLLRKARAGYRAGHDRIIDHMMMDGLEDAYETGRSMGDFGEPPRRPISSPAPIRTPMRSRP